MDHLDAGALVGWKAHLTGSRIVLTMQSMHQREHGPGENPSATGKDERELRERALLVDRNQAVLLANYLYELTGQSRPQRRSWLRSMFGT